MTEDNLKEIEQKTYRYSEQEGFNEIFMGLLLMLYAGVFDWALSGLKSPFPYHLIFIFAFSPIILLTLRKLITYPRIGYVKLKPEKIKTSYLLLVIFPFAFFPMILAISLIYFRDVLNFDPLLRWLPVFFGILFVGLFHYSFADRYGNRIYYSFAALSVIGGLILSIMEFSSARMGFIVFLVGMGSLLILFGSIRFILFLRKYPKPVEVPDDPTERT